MAKKQEAKKQEFPAPPEHTAVPNLPCSACGSQRRTPDVQTNEAEYAGLDQGKPFTHIVWLQSQCSDCGQTRMKRVFEDRTKKPAPQSDEP